MMNRKSEGQDDGGKWGVYLRAPDIWFELQDHYGHNFCPLGEIAEVHFGVKTGQTNFFIPETSPLNTFLTEMNLPIPYLVTEFPTIKLSLAKFAFWPVVREEVRLNPLSQIT